MKNPLPFMSITVYNWHYYPKMIAWKIENRNLLEDNSELRNTINLSILIDLTTFIEGFLTKILNNTIDKRQDKDNLFSKKIIEHYKLKITELTWSKYNEYVELILGNKLSQITNNETYKAINILFTFRNLVVHANDLRIHYHQNGTKEDYYSDSKFNSIIDFLKEKKLADWNLATLFKNDGVINFINDNIVDYFHASTINFIKDLIKNLPENEKDDFKFHFPEYCE